MTEMPDLEVLVGTLVALGSTGKGPPDPHVNKTSSRSRNQQETGQIRDPHVLTPESVTPNFALMCRLAGEGTSDGGREQPHRSPRPQEDQYPGRSYWPL